jgi:hypothetical protein
MEDALQQEREALKQKSLAVRHVQKHLPDTPQSARLIRKEGAAHVFLDEATMNRVAEAILERGQKTGVLRGHERWGLAFEEPIGFRIDAQGDRVPLYYGELKVSGEQYHVIPRNGPGR